MQTPLQPYWQINEGSSTAQLTWDAFKATIRGEYISAIKAARTQYSHNTEVLQEKEQVYAQIYADNPSSASLADLHQGRRGLHLHYKDMTKKDSKRMMERVFERGDKNGCLQAMLVADGYASTVVPCVYSPSGSLVSSREEILDAFLSFYATLYSSILSYPKEDLAALLEPLHLPTLPSEVSELLDSPFRPEELDAAVASFPNQKAPGPDGLPAEWYRQHKEIILPRLLAFYRECLKMGQLPPSMYEDFIPLNVAPIVQMLKLRTQAWRNLPLSLIGKINLLKMNFFPPIPLHL